MTEWRRPCDGVGLFGGSPPRRVGDDRYSSAVAATALVLLAAMVAGVGIVSMRSNADSDPRPTVSEPRQPPEWVDRGERPADSVAVDVASFAALKWSVLFAGRNYLDYPQAHREAGATCSRSGDWGARCTVSWPAFGMSKRIGCPAWITSEFQCHEITVQRGV